MEPTRYQRGSVFQKGKNKIWYGIYREDVRTPAGTSDDSERVRLGTVAELPTKNAAQNKLAEKWAIAPTTDMTFHDAELTRWQTAIGPTYKTSTLEHYTNALRAYVLPTFKDRRIAAINREMIQNFLAEQAEKYSKSTLRSMRAVLRLTLGWAANNNYIRKNPCTGIKLPLEACEDRTVKRHNLTPMQIAALGEHVAGTLCNAGAVHFADRSAHRGSCRRQGIRLRRRCHPHLRRIYNGKVGTCKIEEVNPGAACLWRIEGKNAPDRG